MNKIDRIGETNYNSFGTLMILIEYNNARDIWVEFQDEYKARVHTAYCHFKKGEVKNPYDKSVFNIGYLGENNRTHKNYTDAYKSWVRMMQRCYDPYYINKYPTYIDCFVCKEWHCFQNFAEWYDDNIYKCNDERIELDKDILIKGNKIYSPETCVFTPKRINYLFTKTNAKRGNYLIGVYWQKKDNVFIAECSYLNKKGEKKSKYLGRYDSEFQAFMIYKEFKEEYIKRVAEEYKDRIPTKLYKALYRYEVEIND